MAVEAAYRVMDGATLTDRPPLPGQLYFFVPQEFTGDTVPAEQEEARRQLEQVSLILRLAFQKWHGEEFTSYHNRLLNIAWGTFSPANGFQKYALSELDTLRSEVVQKEGGKLKSRYLWWIASMSGIAALLILCASLAIAVVVDKYKNSGAIKEATVRLGADGNNEGGIEKKVSEVPRLIRWDIDYAVSHTGVLVAASMVGIFLATYVRNSFITFDSFILQQADLMPASIRLLAYALANTVIALVLQIPLFSISIGNAFSTNDINKSLGTAALIGLLLGGSEMAVLAVFRNMSQMFLSQIQQSAASSMGSKGSSTP